MKEGLRRLYSGDFNTVDVEPLPDGSTLITLQRSGEGKVYKFKVRNLYKENEEVLEEEVIDTKIPKYLQDRMEEARRQGGKP